MKSNVHFALALAGLSAIALPAAAANAAAVTIAQGSDYVMVSDGGAMTSVSANQTIGEGQMFAVTADGSVMVSQGEAEYALDAGTYSVDADGALLDAAGNPVAEAGAGTPGPSGAAPAPAVLPSWFAATWSSVVTSLAISTSFLGFTYYAQNYYDDAYARFRTIQVGPYGTVY